MSTLSDTVERVMSGLKPMSPEVEATIRRIEEERLREYRAGRTMALRQDWNAPLRHVQTKPVKSNGWGSKLAVLEKKVGTGMLIGLVGIRGGGKTQMSVELMKDSTCKLRSCLFTTAMDFFITLKKSYRESSDVDEQRTLCRYKKRKLLVIDEIGKRGETEWENNMLFEVINARYNDMLDTILIDNRSKDEFIATIGPSLSSRMNECGGIVECNWPSFRE